MNLKDKVCIVTGSTRGIGLAVATELAGQGAKVVISGRSADTVDKTVADIKSAGGEVTGIAADVSKMEDAQKLITGTIDAFGRIDVLINNAGITRDNLLMRMSEEDWDMVMAVNLKGAFNCVKSATRTLMKQRAGTIINITSVVGLIGNAGQANYAASKAGLIGFTWSVAKELAARNITCNAIAPGFIETDMTEALDEKVRDALLEQIPLKRLGQAKEVARMVCFLASDDAGYITGQVFNVDGGMVMG